MNELKRIVKNRNGQSLVEYAMILTLIAIVTVLVLRGMGCKIQLKLGSVNSNLQ